MESRENAKRLNSYRAILQKLEEIVGRLNGLEERLNKLESSQSSQSFQPVLQESSIPESFGLLGGRTILQSSAGLQKIVRIPCCDICGARLNDEFKICDRCRRKLCKECSIIYENKVCCIECLKEIIPLTKEAYKVLLCIANGITNTKVLAELVKLRESDVEELLEGLVKLELVKKEGLFVFSNFKITHQGIVAICAYKQAYGKDEDVTLLCKEVREHLEKKFGNVELVA